MVKHRTERNSNGIAVIRPDLQRNGMDMIGMVMERQCLDMLRKGEVLPSNVEQ